MKHQNVSIGLINPKSPDNVHSVLRAAGNFRVSSVIYTGNRYPKALRLNPNAPDMSRKVSEIVKLTQTDNLLDAVNSDMKIVCVELAENALPLTDFVHPTNVLYVFGSEDSTIKQDIIDKADAVVYVPTEGCMNLSATVNVVLYDRLAKSADRSKFENNEQILSNRDVNNWLKVGR